MAAGAKVEALSPLIHISLFGSLKQKPAKSQPGGDWVSVIDILFHVSRNVT